MGTQQAHGIHYSGENLFLVLNEEADGLGELEEGFTHGTVSSGVASLTYGDGVGEGGSDLRDSVLGYLKLGEDYVRV